MHRDILIVCLLVAVAFAGCNDDPATPPTLTAADCQADGLVLGDVDGEPACVTPPPPAVAAITGLPDGAAAYEELSFQWVLSTDAEESHAMRTEARVAMAPMEVTDATEPDSYGKLVARKEHQNFVSGDAFDATYRPEAEGSYHFRAYALVNGKHIWSDEYTVAVGPVQPTGTSHTITIPAGAMVADPDLGEQVVNVGDAVVFKNDDLVAHAIASTRGDPPFDIEVAASGQSDPIVFLKPGVWEYASDDVEPISGTIRVALP